MAYKTKFIGRIEKRLPVVIVLRLASEQGQPANGAELTYTDNVSARGARVVSRSAMEIGKMVTVTPLKDEIAMWAKVVYCHQVTDGRYCIGLNFKDRLVAWSTYAVYANS